MRAQSLHPSVVVVDLRVSGMGGIAATERLHEIASETMQIRERERVQPVRRPRPSSQTPAWAFPSRARHIPRGSRQDTSYGW